MFDSHDAGVFVLGVLSASIVWSVGLILDAVVDVHKSRNRKFPDMKKITKGVTDEIALGIVSLDGKNGDSGNGRHDAGRG